MKCDHVVDDLTKQLLEPTLVKAARRTDIDFFKSKDVWEMATDQEARRITGRAPISVRWVDVNKGDDIVPNDRSRLVARDIRTAGEDPMFAPTPPLEAIRRVLSLCGSHRNCQPRLGPAG